MSELDILPNELIVCILRHLGAEDLTKVALTCTRLYELTRLDTLWQRLCEQDYKFDSKEGWGDSTTHRDIYSKVLYPYGHCLGLWRNSTTHYGLFVHVKLEKGQFVARYCKFPKREDVRTPLCWSKPVFSVTMKDGEGQAICHKKCPSWGVHLKVKDDTLHYTCDLCLESVRSLSDEEVFSKWVEEARPDLDNGRPDHIFKGFGIAKTTRLWSNYSLQKIPPAVQSPLSPITLGLYKGTYGSHGIEIVNLTVSDNEYQILGDKILGDPNVPAGVISLYIDLRRPIILTEDQQDYSSLNALDPETLSSPYRFAPDASQPFSLSEEIYMRDVNNLPTTCKARYAGQGQIAAHGYINPDLCRGHFVVFSKDYFGFLWLDLTSFSVFRLVEDDFS